MKIKRFADMPAGSEEARIAGYPRFCPNAPLRRASAAVMMSRALALTP